MLHIAVKFLWELDSAILFRFFFFFWSSVIQYFNVVFFQYDFPYLTRSVLSFKWICLLLTNCVFIDVVGGSPVCGK